MAPKRPKSRIFGVKITRKKFCEIMSEAKKLETELGKVSPEKM